MERKHWTLLALHFAEGKPLTPVQLQKSLFLLGEGFGDSIGDFYHFIPHNYGPFDADIYRDAMELEREGFAIGKPYPGRSWLQYRVTPEGETKALQVCGEAPSEARDYLEKVVNWILPLSFEEIVTTIYSRFPKYRVNSVFQNIP